MKETASTIDLSQTLERIDIDSAAGASTSITLSSGDRSQVVRSCSSVAPRQTFSGDAFVSRETDLRTIRKATLHSICRTW